MTATTRVLLVDDSVVIRGILSKFVDGEPDLEVVSTAPNGKIGVEKVRSLEPDVVVLDVEMPVIDGLSALQEIRRSHPKLPVIMFSTLTGKGASTTLDALAMGASDYATKPSATTGRLAALEHVQGELLTKIRALAGATRSRRRTADRATARSTRPTSPAAPVAATAATPPRRRPPGGGLVRAVVVGSSTGGPVALERVLSSIGPLRVPVLVVQHMPATFTKALAERLDRKTAHNVAEAEHGMVVEPGRVLVAPGGKHMRVVQHGSEVTVALDEGPLVNSCRPSVDPLFTSAADLWGSGTMAVMLTGMGDDGTDGSRRLADLGCHVVAQDEESSTVWGMPGSVVQGGLASEVLPLDEIGPRIATIVHGTGARRGASRPDLRVGAP